MTDTTIFLFTGAPSAGKTTAAALIIKLLRPYAAKYASLTKGTNELIDQIYSHPQATPWVVDNWTTYEEAIELKGRACASLITITIERHGTLTTESPMGRTSHNIENNSTIADLERQLGAMLRQYYPAATG